MLDDVPVDGSNVRLKNHRRFNGVGGKPAMNLVRFFVDARQSGFPVSATEVLDVDNGHGFEDRRHFMSFVDYDVSCDASEVVRFYRDRLDGFSINGMCSRMDFGRALFYRVLNDFLDGRDLSDVAVTPRSFGFTGEGDFDVFVAERVEHDNPFVCAGVGLYVSGKLI